MSDPYTSLVIPPTISFLNIIPERDEEPSRSELSFSLAQRAEPSSIETDLKEARSAAKDMQEDVEGEGMNEPSLCGCVLGVMCRPLNTALGAGDTIQIDRTSTSFSLNVGNNDVQESGRQILDSTHYQCVHHYDSDEEEYSKETPPPAGQDPSSGKDISAEKDVSPRKESSAKGRWFDMFSRDKPISTSFQTPPPGMVSTSSSFSSPREDAPSSLFTLFPNSSSLKPKRQPNYHAPIRYSHTMSAPLMPHTLPEGETHCFAKFTNDVKSIVILVGATREYDG